MPETPLHYKTIHEIAPLVESGHLSPVDGGGNRLAWLSRSRTAMEAPALQRVDLRPVS